jgi:alkylation response protein AidB-like acyl-CoA dehydrogenase
MSSLRPRVQAYVKSSVLGHESTLDAFAANPGSVYTSFIDAGLANWWIPRDYGGRGVSLEESVHLVEELSYGDAGLAFAFYISILSSTMIALYGSERQKERYLRAMAEEGCFGATLGSERLAGSELLKITASAVRSGDGYRVQGEKFFSTNAAFADHLAVLVRTPGEDLDFRLFLLDRNHPGLRIVQRWRTLGCRAAATYQATLEECMVPAEAALQHNGLRVLEAAMNPSRLLIAATAVGVARRVRDVCLAYAREKPFRDDQLLSSPVFAAKIGEMEMHIEAMHSVCVQAARELDVIMACADAATQLLGRGLLKSVAVAKLLCGQSGWQVASMGSEMLGGLGYTESSLIGKLVRDVRFVSIVEGGEDVMRELLYFRHTLPRLLAG